MAVENVLITLPMNENQKRRVENVAPDATYAYFPAIDIQAHGNPALKQEFVEAADVILGDVPPEMLKHCGKLRFLQLDSAGVKDYINSDLPKSFVLSNATGAYGLAISETMLAMTLMLKKKLHQYGEQQRQHVWKCVGPVTSLEGAVVLCVGMGNIGGEYLRKCKAMGAYTIGVRRVCKDKPEWLDELYMVEDLDELLPKADVVALNLPDTPKTYRMFDAERLAKMRSDAVLINTGRGTVVDTDALCKMLEDGKLAGAALDVTDPEPLPASHPLWDAPNVIITPHITGGYTLKRTLDNIVDLAIENFQRYCSGEELINTVDYSEGYARK